MSTSVLLADDHDVVRIGLRQVIEKAGDFIVVCEAKNGLDAVRLAREQTPDVAVIDIGMPDLNGVEATRRIRKESPRTRVLVMSVQSDVPTVDKSIRAGATGYVPKHAAFDEFVAALRAVAAGETYIAPSIAGPVVADWLLRSTPEANGHPVAVLSPREREVLQLVAEGNATKQIAAKLHLGVKTIESHRHQIMRKLGLHSVAELTKYAVRHGLTTLDQ